MHNSYVMSQLATEHVTGLRRCVAEARRGGGRARPQPPSRVRRRAGWALVSVGLRLAIGRPVGAQ